MAGYDSVMKEIFCFEPTLENNCFEEHFFQNTSLAFDVTVKSKQTLCLSRWMWPRNGSYNNLSGSTFIGDCLLPFVHMFHWGFMRPQ